MSDPLAPFRKRAAGSSAFVMTSEPEGYVAFGTKDKVERLSIHRANQLSRAPSYGHLWDITSNGAVGTEFILVYSFMMVLVQGKNLQPVVKALELGTVDFLQQFDPDRWHLPEDGKAPVITTIEVAMAQETPGLSEGENGFRGPPSKPKPKPH